MFAFGDVKFGPGVLCCSKNGNKYNNEKKKHYNEFSFFTSETFGNLPIIYIFC